VENGIGISHNSGIPLKVIDFTLFLYGLFQSLHFEALNYRIFEGLHADKERFGIQPTKQNGWNQQ